MSLLFRYDTNRLTLVVTTAAINHVKLYMLPSFPFNEYVFNICRVGDIIFLYEIYKLNIIELAYKNADIFQNIWQDINRATRFMLQGIFEQLQGDIQVSECIQLLGYLRTLNMFGDLELRVLFLCSRGVWLDKVSFLFLYFSERRVLFCFCVSLAEFLFLFLSTWFLLIHIATSTLFFYYELDMNGHIYVLKNYHFQIEYSSVYKLVIKIHIDIFRK